MLIQAGEIVGFQYSKPVDQLTSAPPHFPVFDRSEGCSSPVRHFLPSIGVLAIVNDEFQALVGFSHGGCVCTNDCNDLSRYE